MRAAIDQAPIELREAHVVANRQAEAEAVDVDGHDVLLRLARERRVRLAVARAVGEIDVEQVDLAVDGRDPAGVVEHDVRVAGALGIVGDEADAAREDPRAVGARELRQRAQAAPLGRRLAELRRRLGRRALLLDVAHEEAPLGEREEPRPLRAVGEAGDGVEVRVERLLGVELEDGDLERRVRQRHAAHYAPDPGPRARFGSTARRSSGTRTPTKPRGGTSGARTTSATASSTEP